MSTGATVVAGSIDLLESNADVAPDDVTRLRRKAGQLEVSTSGAAYGAVGGSCASDPWLDRVAAFVATKEPTLVSVPFRSTCAKLQNVGTTVSATDSAADVERSAASGTSDCIVDPTKNGGCLKLSTGTTGGQFRYARNTNGIAAAGLTAELIANLRTSKYAVIVRAAFDTPTAGCQYDVARVGAEVANGGVILGVLGSASTVNWAITVGTAAAADTGVALPAAGVFVTVALIADGTNVKAWNVDTGTQIGLAGGYAQSTAVTNPGHWLIFVTNSAAANKNLFCDDVAVITEPAA